MFLFLPNIFVPYIVATKFPSIVSSLKALFLIALYIIFILIFLNPSKSITFKISLLVSIDDNFFLLEEDALIHCLSSYNSIYLDFLSLIEIQLIMVRLFVKFYSLGLLFHQLIFSLVDQCYKYFLCISSAF